MTFLKKLWRQRAQLYFFVVPAALLPVALVDPQPKWQCAYVVVLMACYWLPQVIPIAVTALLPLILFPAFGILTSTKTAQFYMSNSTLIILGGMVLAVAIEVWDLHKRIALRILMCMGSKPRWLLFGLMLSTWFLSMWISNTASTAMMIPIAQAILTQLNDQGLEERQQTYRDNPVLANYRNRRKDTRAYRRACKGLTLSVAYAANIGGLSTLSGTPANIVLKGAIDLMWMTASLPLSFLLLVLTWGWLQLLFLPKTCSDACCCHEGAGSSARIEAAIREEYKRLGPLTFAEFSVLTMFLLLVVLWVTRDLGGAGGWGLLFPARYVSDATAAVAIAILLTVLPSKNPLRPLNTGNNAADIDQNTLLSWQQINSKMPWSIVLLIGGGLSLAKACEISGLSEWVGERLESLSHLHPTYTLLIVCYAVTAATEVTNNVAIATLLLPVLQQLALATRVHPLYYMFPATLSASLAFMLPVATPPNAIVFASGYVKIKDMVVTGLVLNILTVPLVVLATETWAKAVFALDVFPDCLANVTQRNNASLSN